MSIPEADQRKLCMRSGGRCAFPKCRRPLIVKGDSNEVAVLGEMAHMVAESANGPRGEAYLTLSERNRYNNLILLCNLHHQLVDSQPQTYSVERLGAIKEEHERWVEKTLGFGVEGDWPSPEPVLTTDTVFSTLLPVQHLPPYLYGTHCGLDEPSIQKRLLSLRSNEAAPFILRGQMLWAFQNLEENDNPFAPLVEAPVERVRADSWWGDSDRERWYVDLLNRALNKITGRRGLNLDRLHRRYYFPTGEKILERSITYRPLNRAESTISVVWQPIRKKTGLPGRYWYHRAVQLRFLHVAAYSWCLSVRPAIHVTDDGRQAPRSDLIGRRVTRKLARLHNYEVLGEVNFWRDYLSDSRPRIILPFGSSGQYLQISTQLLAGEVTWPGIPTEFARAFQNVSYEDDLFSWADVNAVEAAESAEVDRDREDEEDEEEGE